MKKLILFLGFIGLTLSASTTFNYNDCINEAKANYYYTYKYCSTNDCRKATTLLFIRNTNICKDKLADSNTSK